MALQTQTVTVNFQQGLAQGIDPFQLPVGRFEILENGVFDKIGRLTKRYGFPAVQSLPDTTSSFVTTFNGSLTAIGRDLKDFSPGPSLWTSKGQLSPLSLNVVPLINNNSAQTQVDTATSPNGLMCVVFAEDQVIQSTTQSFYKYSVLDATTGQSVVAPTRISSSFGSVSHAARVFALQNYFVVAFGSTASGGASSHLQYFSINSFNPRNISSVTDISTSYAPLSTVPFDGVVANNSLYFSWSGAGGSGIKAAKLGSNFSLSSEVTIASGTASLVSVTADQTTPTPIIWTSFYLSSGGSGRAVATGTNLATLFSAVEFVNSSSAQLLNLASVAQSGAMNMKYEVTNYYSYPSSTGSVSSNLINSRSITQTGSLSATASVVRSVGLASKQFLIGSESYFMSVYNSTFQPTYFLMNSAGGVISKLAYSNGRGYLTTGLPSVNVNGTSATVGYLRKNQIQAVNKDTNVSSTNQSVGVYSQTGVNAAVFQFNSDGLNVSEAGRNLNISGGILWAYDGNIINENGFNLWPDNVSLASGGVVGSITAQQYFYQATYEWTDNQGNWFRSAPSVPQSITVSSGTAAVVVRVPTLRVTYKTANPVKIVIYRWSAAQQTYYQTTSITQPVLNDVNVDSISFTDRNSDSTILGNNIIYTNGGVLENIGAPPSSAVTLFDTRLWTIDAENPNLLWYSKTILDQTPVEMSDQLTRYVAPNASAQGPTGPMKCIAPMDDKLIIFKKNALYYINGTGPDSTGASSQYSEPIFITSTVGCENQNSIVLIPQGLMFQSDKGIWILGRDLSTSYIGKDVENYNSSKVLSALAVPGTNQVRFTLDDGSVLIYDYFTNQWGTFTGISGISSTLFQNLHTYIDGYGRVFQERPGTYLDGSNPVLMSFKTGWLNLAGLQGYQRAYAMYLLGVYKSPHILRAGVAYDYDSSVQQLATIVPNNFTGTWGSGTSWGSISYWGGNTSREQWEINYRRQQCQSLQVSFQEFYDPALGIPAGAGLTISGISIVSGFKKGYPRNMPVANRIG